VRQVDVYYLHAPDRRLPWKETLAGVNELYKRGAFKRLGLSNFLGPEITEVVRVAKENGFVVPTVYQGNYSAIARRLEDEVIPVLRSNKLSLYAYSPIAGGFLSKSKEQLSDPEGRFGDKNPLSELYNGMYNRPAFLAILDFWATIAENEGVSRAELAYRWIAYHSIVSTGSGDAIVVGARTPDQLRETVAAIQKGPLSELAVAMIEQVWGKVMTEALLDNFQHLKKA
jgi:aflatoxin B1 aldehyde reductase